MQVVFSMFDGAMCGKPPGIYPRLIRSIIRQKTILPFMEFAMTVSVRKRTGVTVIDGRPVVDSRSICYVFKVTIIDRDRILIQKNKTICRGKPAAKTRVLDRKRIRRIKTITATLKNPRKDSAILIGRTRPIMRLIVVWR